MVRKISLSRVYKESIDRIRKNYDIILIDCHPNLGHSVTAANLSAYELFTPVSPEKFAIEGLQIIFNELDNINVEYCNSPNINIIFNKFGSRTILSNLILSELIKSNIYSSYLLSTYIRFSQEFPNSIVQNISIFDNTSLKPSKEDVMLLWI